MLDYWTNAIPGDPTFDPYASDSDNSDREEIEALRSPPELSDEAETIFAGIKWRTAIHVGKIRDWWREFQANKHCNPSVDKEGVNRDVGALVELDPMHRRGKELWDIVHGKADIKLRERFEERMKKLIDRLRLATETYRYEVFWLWVIIDRKRTPQLASLQLWQDVGKLMQLDDVEAKEILRRLREMGKTGELMSPKLKWDTTLAGPPLDEDWYLDHKYLPYYTEPPPDPTPAPPISLSPTPMPQTPSRTGRRQKRAHRQNPNILGNLTLQSDSEDEMPRKKKRRTEDSGYRVGHGDWRCGKCDSWNRQIWGTCHNESCNGTCGENAVEMHQMQVIL